MKHCENNKKEILFDGKTFDEIAEELLQRVKNTYWVTISIANEGTFQHYIDALSYSDVERVVKLHFGDNARIINITNTN